MEEHFSQEQRKHHLEKELILRKSLLRGQSPKIARDNVRLRENLKNMARNFLKEAGNGEQQSSG